VCVRARERGTPVGEGLAEGAGEGEGRGGTDMGRTSSSHEEGARKKRYVEIERGRGRERDKEREWNEGPSRERKNDCVHVRTFLIRRLVARRRIDAAFRPCVHTTFGFNRQAASFFTNCIYKLSWSPPSSHFSFAERTGGGGGEGEAGRKDVASATHRPTVLKGILPSM
jgi:hypothetical protein